MKTFFTEHARLRVDAARDVLAPSHGRTSSIAHEVVSTLLVDLRHFCQARHIDFDRVNQLAGSMFERAGRGS